jgi:hypothetical protein
MRLIRYSAALLTAASLCVSGAQAQQPNANEFVHEIALATGDDNPLARWDEGVCVGAVGLDPSQLQQLVDRVSQRARAVGLRPGRAGCRANVMVVFSNDSDMIARQIVDQRRDMLGFYSGDNRITAGREAMEEFANTPRPIRWWHVSSTGVGSMRPDAARTWQNSGTTAAIAASASGSGGVSGVSPGDVGSAQDLQGADGVRSNGSRMRTEESSNELSYALIIVDAHRVANTPTSAWMDYVAFNALAQINPDARTTNYSTILNLFSQSSSPPAQLTAWDLAYLDALYRVRSEDSDRQIPAIARRVSDTAP